jgi:hypothetical protein
MVDWWRSWHGAPTDPKWRSVGRRAGVPAGVVAAIVWTLLDRASQAERRGSITGYDAEDIANALDFDLADVERVIGALGDKGVLIDERFAAWERRQPEREDESSTERSRKFREKQRQLALELPEPRPGAVLSVAPAADATHRNAVQRDATPESEEKREDLSVCPSAPLPREVRATGSPTDGLTDEFLIGKLGEAIGSRAGPGLLTPQGVRPIRRLLEHCGCDLERDVLPVVRDTAEHLTEPWRKFCGRLSNDKILSHSRLRVANEARARGRPAQIFVEVDSAQWRAWIAQEGGKPRTAMDFAVAGKRRKGWYFPSEWPPSATAGNG